MFYSSQWTVDLLPYIFVKRIFSSTSGLNMDPLLIVLVAIAISLVIAGLVFIVVNRGGSARLTKEVIASQAELAGRLAQLGENQTAHQVRLAELMQKQEREVSQKLEQKLADLTRKLGEGIEKTNLNQQTVLGDLKERLAVIDAAQKNITELSSQVVGLHEILSNKQARGAFGEIQLSDLVRSILPPNAYVFQAPIGENRRVDCLINLPNPPGSIAIDAKFPLESYRALVSSNNDVSRAQNRKALANDVQRHVQDIASKYIVPGQTAESALLFLPSEAVYAELHANLPDVVEQSWRAKVWIVSPTTLMATLNTIRAVLKDAQMREQADVIQSEVGILLTDVERLDNRVVKLETHFRQAEDDMRQILISTEKITKRGVRIQEIEVGATPTDNTEEVGREIEVSKSVSNLKSRFVG